ncbi:hypothetical protein P0100_20315, partial [Yersinia pestis]|nr:hypothetical protein [Yersinia pestis]
MNTNVLSVGAAIITIESFGTSYTALVTDGGLSELGESASLTAAAPESLGELSAYAVTENATVCKTSIIARHKESIALPMLRFRFKKHFSSIPETAGIFSDNKIIDPITLNRIDTFCLLDPSSSL